MNTWWGRLLEKLFLFVATGLFFVLIGGSVWFVETTQRGHLSKSTRDFAVFVTVIVAMGLWFAFILGFMYVRHKLRPREAGLIVTTDFRARRAFELDEYEDEGASYFIELEDGRVLFLTGQYLYEYAEDEEEHRPRTFPTTEFSVQRHKTKGHVVDIILRGTVLQPEVTAPPFYEDREPDACPEDGEIISDKTYDQLKADRLARARSA